MQSSSWVHKHKYNIQKTPNSTVTATLLKPSLVLLQAGEKHYHPTCARCVRCEQMFAEGEEMYLQGKCKFWVPFIFVCRSLKDFFYCSSKLQSR